MRFTFRLGCRSAADGSLRNCQRRSRSREGFFAELGRLAATLALVVTTILASAGTLAAQAAPTPPNFLLILTDDMTEAMLQHMPRTVALIRNRAVEFPNAIPEDNLCAPSRATLLAGRYSHNTGIDTLASVDRLYELAPTSLGKLLQARGYRTGLFGKYTNAYDWNAPVPVGWSRWVVIARRPGVIPDCQLKCDPYLNIDGQPERRFGWSAEIVGAEARAFMRAAGPWFTIYAPTEPHTPHVWPARHNTLFAGAKAPRDARFNEADVSDKPPAMRLPLMSTQTIGLVDWRWRSALKSLQRVDEQVELILREAPPNTYVIFTSDNGYFYGQHRRPEQKTLTYAAATDIPFLVAGPGITHAVRSHLVTHADILPTLLRLAGAAVPNYADGRSLVPLLTSASAPWRHALPQHYANAQQDGPAQAVRTDRYTFTRYASGAEELYDLQVDPLQLQNRASRSAYAERKTKLRKLTNDLATCAGATCRTIDARVIN